MMIVIPVVILLFGSLWIERTRRRNRMKRDLRLSWGDRIDRFRNFDAIRSWHDGRQLSGVVSGSVDDRTWSDLHLDDVFDRVDRTGSSIGQQSLYDRLRTTPQASDLDSFEALVSRFSTDEETRISAQVALTRMWHGNGANLWRLALGESFETPGWYAAFPLVTAIALVSIGLIPFWQPTPLIIVILCVLTGIVARVVTSKRVLQRIGTFREVGPLLFAGRELARLIDLETTPTTAKLKDDVQTLKPLGRIARWVSRDPIAAGEVVASLFEYLNIILLLDVNALYFGSRELRVHGDALLRLIGAVGEVDAAISVASFRAGTRGWVRPVHLAPGSAAILTDLCHPLINDAVPNSLTLDPPKGYIVTGSNMSGKTTFVRTVGVNVVLAQTINTVLATEYHAPCLAVRTCIGQSDDLLAGKSYYLAEVEAVLDLVRASQSRAQQLFLFDELFRGTNTIERIAAAEAVLRRLVSGDGSDDRAQHLVLAATHDGELVTLLADSFAAVHFSEAIDASGISFDYRMQPGPATTRNAIALLRLYGAPSAIVDQATARAAIMDAAQRTSQGESSR